MTVQELIQQAMTKSGRLGTARTGGGAELGACLGFLNTLVDNWNSQRCYVAGLDTVPVSLVSGTRSYTLATRPLHIERAEVVTTAGGLSYPSPLEVCGVERFAAISNQGDVTPFPKGIWCDYGNPTAKVYLAPTPGTGTLNLYTWYQLTAFAALDDDVTLPVGVERALVNNLALELCAAYGLAVNPGLIASAGETRAAMQKLNEWHAADAKQTAYPDGVKA